MNWFRKRKNLVEDSQKISIKDLELMAKYGKAGNSIGNYTSKSFIELPYGLVKIKLPQLFAENNTEGMINLIMKSQYPDFDASNSSGNEVIAFSLWVKAEMERIVVLEKTYLRSDPEPEMLAAGIMKLNEFGEMATIDTLAKGNILEYEKIEALPYFQVYQKLKLDKAHREIEKKYNKIMVDKAKRK